MRNVILRTLRFVSFSLLYSCFVERSISSTGRPQMLHCSRKVFDIYFTHLCFVIANTSITILMCSWKQSSYYTQACLVASYTTIRMNVHMKVLHKCNRSRHTRNCIALLIVLYKTLIH